MAVEDKRLIRVAFPKFSSSSAPHFLVCLSTSFLLSALSLSKKTLHIERAAASIGTLLPTPPLQESVGSIYKMAINSKQRLYCTLQYIKLFNVINYCDLIITAMLEAGSLKLSYRLENFPSSRLVAGDSVIGKIPPSAPKPCCLLLPNVTLFFLLCNLALSL